jgi:hypothetical protein
MTPQLSLMAALLPLHLPERLNASLGGILDDFMHVSFGLSILSLHFRIASPTLS